MKKYILCLLITAFFGFFADDCFSAVAENSDHMILDLRNVTAKFMLNSGGQRILTLASRDAASCLAKGSTAEDLVIIAAVPDYSDLSVSVIGYETGKALPNDERGIFNSVEKDYPDALEYAFIGDDFRGIAVCKYGIKRGVKLIKIFVRPFVGSGKGLALVSSLKLELRYGSPVNLDNKFTGTEADIFSSVSNPKAAAYLSARSADEMRIATKSLSTEASWYNPSLNYVRAVTKEDAVSKISGKDLVAQRPELTGLSVDYLRMYFDGAEIPLKILPETDNLISESTEVFFLGRHAKGDSTWLDYYTDEAVFYLAWDPSGKGLRFDAFPSLKGDEPEVTTGKRLYHAEKEIFFYSDNSYYSYNTPYKDWYWMPLDPTNKSSQNDSLVLHPVEGESYSINSRFATWSAQSSVGKCHKLIAKINGDSVASVTSGYSSKIFLSGRFSTNKLIEGKNEINFVSVKLTDKNGNVTDSTSVAGFDWYEIGGRFKNICSEPHTFLTIDSLAVRSKAVLTSSQPVAVLSESGLVFGLYTPVETKVSLCLEAQKKYDLTISSLSSVVTVGVSKVNNTDWRNISGSADCFAVYYKDFKGGTEKLCAYHDSRNQKMIPADFEDLCKEFTGGRRSPRAIKEFLKNSRSKMIGFPAYLTLIGEDCKDPRKSSTVTVNNSYIPGYGNPVTDYWFSLLDDDISGIPQIIVSRIPARTNDEVLDYINKYAYADTSRPDIYQNKALFISGGSNTFERADFRNTLIAAYNVMNSHDVCIDSIFVSKSPVDYVDIAQGPIIRKAIDNGVGFVTFFGHGSARDFDTDGWQAELLNNHNKYPFLVTLSCNTGDFGTERDRARNCAYVMAKEGFVGSFGFSFLSQTDNNLQIISSFYPFIGAKDRPAETYSALTFKMKEITNDITLSSLINYFGDPFLHPVFGKTDLKFDEHSFFVLNPEGDNTVTDFDSVAFVNIDIINTGFRYSRPVDIRAIRHFGEYSDTVTTSVSNICQTDRIVFKFPVKNMKGIHTIDFTVNPGFESEEMYADNNTFTARFEVFSKGLILLDPEKNGNTTVHNPVFRFLVPGKKNYDAFKVSVLAENRTDTVAVFDKSVWHESELYVDAKPTLDLQASKLYYVNISFTDDDGKLQTLLRQPFYADPDFDISSSSFSQFSNTELKYGIFNSMRLDSIDSSRVILNDYTRNFEILASTWDDVAQTYTCRITYNDTVIVETPNLGAKPRGFNVVNIDAEGLQVVGIKNFDTWGNDYHPEIDSVGVRLVSYLRDSIPAGNYMMIATCDQALRIPLVDIGLRWSGSLDTLKQVLRDYGLKDVDSLVFGASIAMLGRKGAAPGALPQKVIVAKGGVAVTSGRTEAKNRIGSYESITAGPVKAWKQCRVSGYFPEDSVWTSLLVYGYDASMNRNPVPIYSANGSSADLSGINASDYPYIKAVFNIYRAEKACTPFIKSVDFSYLPLPETAVSKNESYIVGDTVLRGDTIKLCGKLYNISRRSTADSVKFVLGARSASGYVVDTLITKYDIRPGESAEDSLSIATELYRDRTDAYIKTTPGIGRTDLYLFNNSQTIGFVTIEDTLKPNISILANGKLLHDGDYVPLHSEFRIELSDQSLLPVDSNSILVRLNGYMIDANNSEKRYFVSEGYSRPLKAYLDFTKQCDYDENIISVYALDGSGNADTAKIKFLTARGAEYSDPIIAPNPTTGDCRININLTSQNASGEMKVEVFNIIGLRVAEFRKSAVLGKNSISWTALDDNGNALLPGVYYIRISSADNLWAEPREEKFTIIR